MEVTLEQVKQSIDAIAGSQLIILGALQRNYDELQNIQEDQEEMQPTSEIPKNGPITKDQANALAAASVNLSVRFPKARNVAVFTRVSMFGLQRWTRDLK